MQLHISRYLLAAFITFTSFSACAAETNVSPGLYDDFIDKMVSEHQFDRNELSTLLNKAVVKESILKAMSSPAEKRLQWHSYRNIFLKPNRINGGVRFWQENKTLLEDYQLKFSAMINAVISKASEYPGIVVIVAQGNHGVMLVELFDEQSSNPVSVMPNAVILLSSYALTNQQLVDTANSDFAKKIAYSEYPILDLYLRYDHPIVLDKTKQRLALAKKEMKVYYRQRQLNNSSVGYYPEQELMIQINSWLKSIGW